MTRPFQAGLWRVSFDSQAIISIAKNYCHHILGFKILGRIESTEVIIRERNPEAHIFFAFHKHVLHTQTRSHTKKRAQVTHRSNAETLDNRSVYEKRFLKLWLRYHPLLRRDVCRLHRLSRTATRAHSMCRTGGSSWGVGYSTRDSTIAPIGRNLRPGRYLQLGVLPEAAAVVIAHCFGVAERLQHGVGDQDAVRQGGRVASNVRVRS